MNNDTRPDTPHPASLDSDGKPVKARKTGKRDSWREEAAQRFALLCGVYRVPPVRPLEPDEHPFDKAVCDGHAARDNLLCALASQITSDWKRHRLNGHDKRTAPSADVLLGTLALCFEDITARRSARLDAYAAMHKKEGQP